MGDQLLGYTEKVGDPSAVTNTNPMTTNVYNFLQQLASGQGLSSQLEGLQGVTPGIQGIASQLTSPYAGNRLALAEQMAAQNQRNTAAQFANLGGGVHSGGFVEAMAQGGAQPYMQAVTDIAGMGTGISQNLLGQFGNYVSQGIQGRTAYGAPEWWQPTYVQHEGLLQGLMGAIPGIATAALTGNPGFLTSLLGMGQQQQTQTTQPTLGGITPGGHPGTLNNWTSGNSYRDQFGINWNY